MEEQNNLLSSMERIITQKLEDFGQIRRAFTQAQIMRLQHSVQKQESFTFRKKGNEKQHKVNASVLDKMKEADVHLQDVAISHQSEAISSAIEEVSQGIDI
jgi:hypothetical protein